MKTGQKEWAEICRAYCNRIGAELIFANYRNGDLGFELNGELVHIGADELAARVQALDEKPTHQQTM